MRTVQLIAIEDIAGLSEIASMLGRRKQTVCNWIERGTHETPRPIAELAATKLYDRNAWRRWAADHPELTGGS
jgi:hypothetical protein